MNPLEKEFVPYPEAFELKQLGFDEPCYKYIYIGDTGINVDHYLEVEPSKARNYNEDSLCISQPTFSQAFRWFREKHRLFHFITREVGINTSDIFFVASYYKGKKGNSPRNTCVSSNTYEEAELACLRKLIEIVKNK